MPGRTFPPFPQAEYEETAKKAMQHVKFAAGLAHFIATEVQPLKEVLPFERPPEVHADLLRSVSLMYQATGQSIACRQVRPVWLPETHTAICMCFRIW